MHVDSQFPVSPRVTFSLVRWTGSSAAQGGGGLVSFDTRVTAGSILYISVEAGLSLGVSAGSILQVAVLNSEGQPINLVKEANSRFGIRIESKCEKIGHYFVPAEVWPSATVQKGTAAATETLLSSLCLEGGDKTVGLYVPRLDMNQSKGFAETVCLELFVRSSGVKREMLNAASGDTEPSQKAVCSSPTQVTTEREALSPDPKKTPKSSKKRSKKVTNEKRKDSNDAVRRKWLELQNSFSISFEDQWESLRQDLVQGKLSHMLENALKSLIHHILHKRYVLEGNIVEIPVAGVKVFFYISSTKCETNDPNVPKLIKSNGQIRISGFEKVEIKLEDRLATKALKAAAQYLDLSDSHPAVLAAYNAFRCGNRSLDSSLNDLGGLKSQMEFLRRSIITPFTSENRKRISSELLPTGILLYGPPGTGKSALARATAADAKASFFVLNGPDIVSENLGESEASLRGIFAAAIATAPSIIFIDEIDSIAPSRSLQFGAAARLVTTLVAELDAAANSAVVVLGATNRRDSIDDSLRRPGRFDREIEVGVPRPEERRDILLSMLKNTKCKIASDDLENLSKKLHGFVGADLQALCNEAALYALRRCISNDRKSPCITSEDLYLAKSRIRPSALREVLLEYPNVAWTDIGGYEPIKQQLKEVVEWPLKFQDRLKRFGAMPPKGILLYGPPGCSKTLLARAVAKESSMNFISIKGPELLKKYVGESEKAVRGVFHKAKSASPCVIFFDEIDGLVRSRGKTHRSSDQFSDRVLSQLLQEMDGFRTSKHPIVVIGATNRPQSIDDALLRPGRFDRLLYVPPPDKAARLAIFRIHSTKMPLDQDVDLKRLAEKSEGLTGADIANVCQKGALLALEDRNNVQTVQMKHLNQALSSVLKARTSHPISDGLIKFQRFVK